MAISKVAPLAWNAPIVDEHGNPTPYFQRQLAQLLNEKAATDALAEGAVPNTTQVLAGIGLSGGGALTSDVTLNVDTAAEAERIRDTIGTALVAGTNITITVNDGSDTITIAASGGSGSSWILDTSWDFAVSGATASIISGDLSSYDEALVLFEGNTVSSSANRGVQVSVDGGTSYYSTSGDYKGFDLTTSGVVNSETAIFAHSTATTASRGGMVRLVLKPNGTPKGFITPVRSASSGGFFNGSLSPINKIRAANITAASGAVTGTLTSGKIWILKK